jgi:hypothetical protein
LAAQSRAETTKQRRFRPFADRKVHEVVSTKLLKEKSDFLIHRVVLQKSRFPAEDGPKAGRCFT